MTTVVNIYKNKYDVYCGRAGKGKTGYFGNPFTLKSGDLPGSTLIKYEEYFYNRIANDREFCRSVLELRHKILGCFCKPKPCHCDIIAELLNNNTDEEILKRVLT